MKVQQLKMFFNKVIKEFEIEKLSNEIKEYEGICNRELLDYFEALLFLEINILNDKTYNQEQIEKLKQLEIYRRVVKYNIYGYIKTYIEKMDKKLKITKFEENLSQYSVTYKGQELIEVFFEINKVKETMIELNYIKENIEKRKNAVDIILYELESELGDKNPYHQKYKKRNFDIEEIEKRWIINYETSIEKLENMLQILNSRDELNKEEKKISELSEEIYNEFLNEYNLYEKKSRQKTNIDFNEEKIQEKKLIKHHQLANIYKTTIYY